jgi:hypothetical protein
MKDLILKIAKVKDEAAFYKKFPTEEAFIKKHGKEFKLAQNGLSEIGSLKNQYVEPETPEGDMIDEDFLNTYQSILAGLSAGQQPYKPSKGLAALKGFTQSPLTGMLGGGGGQKSVNEIQPRGVAKPVSQLPATTMKLPTSVSMQTGGGFTSANFGGSKMGNFIGGANVVGSIIDGIEGIRAEKNALRAANQSNQLSNLALQAARTRPEEYERQYARPEDIENTGEEFFPIYGVGTNPIGKDGINIKPENRGKFTAYKKRTGKTTEEALHSPDPHVRQMANFARNAAKWNHGQDGLEMYSDVNNTELQQGGNIYGMIGQGMNAGLDPLYGQNAGKNLGGSVGGAIGSIWGPAGQFVGEQAGKLLGWAIDGTPRKIKKFNQKTQANVGAIAGMGQGAFVQQQYNNIMQGGGDLLGDDLTMQWGGDAKLVSYNPYLPQGGETIEFVGEMHNGNPIPGKSGIGISYGGSNVEVEDGEQATILDTPEGEENLTVFGNLRIPKGMLSDPSAKNKKFKNYVANLSKKEISANKALDKNMENLDQLVPLTSFDKLKMASYEANILGNNMKLKKYADSKREAALAQSSINATAEAYGIVADDLARGKIKVDKGVFVPSNKTAKYGADLSMYDTAQDGTDLGVERKDYMLIKEAYDKAEKSKSKEDVLAFQKLYHKLAPKQAAATLGKAEYELFENEDGSMGKNTKKYMSDLKLKKLKSALEYSPKGTVGMTPSADIDIRQLSKKERAGFDPDLKKIMTSINSVLPAFRPSNVSDFDNNQIAGELYALSNNKVEPVFAQGFTPQLMTPYDISLQDQLNAVTSQTRAGQRMAGYNPVAQAMMASSAYDATNKILGEQFRMNQGKKDQVYSGNTNAMNEAMLKNLGIFDQQANRQSIARSNTKEATQAALNSISSKKAQHALENQKLAILENMYNYRFVNNRAVNMNPLATFDTQVKSGVGNGGESAAERALYYSEMAKKYKEEALGKTTTDDTAKNGKNIGKAINKMSIVKQFKSY